MKEPQDTDRAQAYIILLLMILAWGFSWPIAKIGVQYIQPIWFSFSRLLIACVTVFTVTALIGKLRLPQRREIPIILIVGLAQLGFYQTMISYGIAHTDASRAAILAYLTPFFVTPIAVIIFKEKCSLMKLLGISCGFIGMLVMFNPFTFDWSHSHQVFGNICLMLAAICTAIPMLYIRYAKWTPSPLSVFPWQVLIGAVPVLIVALISEPIPSIDWNLKFIGAALYCGVIATAIGYLALVTISRKLPVINSSIALLIIPLLGITASNMILGETLDMHLIIAIIFITGGLMLVALSDFLKKRQQPKIVSHN